MKTKRNGSKRLCAVLLLSAFLLIPLAGAAAEILNGSFFGGRAAEPADAAECHTLEPHASEGVIITVSEEDSLTVEAHEQDGKLVFDETKTLVFTAEFAEGWSFCADYSVFFPNDPRAHTELNGDGSVTFSFSAAAGGSVDLAVFESNAVNATPEQLPKLEIETDIPFTDINKLEWVDAHFTLTLGTKQFASGDYEGDGKIKGRGNSSWTYPKKPYSIKLSSKASLLDIPKTKKYAIIANYYDGSLMRNYITYKSFQQLIGIGYVPKCEFVDVYLNGEYNGVYLLVERIDIEKSKVNIDEASAEDLTGGYLIEKDCAGKIDLENDLWFNCPYWANGGKDYFVMKAPEPDDPELTAQMLAYLEEHMQRVHDCLINGSGEPYTQYVDPASWADFIIVQEVSKNIDGNFKTSCFMYKQSGDDRIYMTAPWDFDFAYGLVSWTNNSPDHNDCDCPPANTPDGFMTINSSAPWLRSVYENNAEFRDLLRIRYTHYRRTLLTDMTFMINEQAAYLYTAQQADHELWGKNFAYGVRKLRDFLAGRLEWLDEQWLIGDGELDLGFALNLEGGTLNFTAGGDGEAPFVGAVRCGEAVGLANADGVSSLRLTAELRRGEFLAFDYVSPAESLILDVNGESILLEAQPEPGRFCYIAQAAGEYEFTWRFEGSGNGAEAFVDNVSINLGHILGDVNMDGSVTVLDALLALRSSMDVADLGDAALLADINGDGNISIVDALLLLRRSMGVL